METSVEFQFLPPPTHARLPPDGHESPNNNNNHWIAENYAPPLPTSAPPEDDPPPLPSSGPPVHQSRISYHHKAIEHPPPQIDNSTFEPSIRSVKDKIALFSSSSEDSVDYPQTKSLENLTSGFGIASYKPPMVNNNSISSSAQFHSPPPENGSSSNLLEERRKSFSRLRGLVLTDKSHSPLLDLPPIRSKDPPPLITATIPKLQPIGRAASESPTRETPSSEDLKNQWKTSLPKYSPAFKRRTLSPYVPKTQARLPEPPPPKPAPRCAPPASALINGSAEEEEESPKNGLSLLIPSPPSAVTFQEAHDISFPAPTAPPVSDGMGQHEHRNNIATPSVLPQDKEFSSSESEEEDEGIRPPPKQQQSPLQAIFDMELQMAYVNEICDALPSNGTGYGYYSKRRDSEVTVIERPISGSGTLMREERKSPGREIKTPMTSTPVSSPTKEIPQPQWAQKSIVTNPTPTSSNFIVKTPPVIEKSSPPKVAGILEKKIERIIEKTMDGVGPKPSRSTTSIPRGRNDFKSLSEKWQQISTQAKPTAPASEAPRAMREFVLPSQQPQRNRTISVNDIRLAFEKAEDAVDSYGREDHHNSKGTPPELLSPPSAHFRVSSFDSTTSEESNTPGTSLLSSVPRDPYGSITSLASSTSLISPAELQQLIEEANQSLEEAGTPSHEVSVLILHREFPGGSLGITLAGGADYETKEITVHKVLTGSIADRDGRIFRGDRVLSINGKNTKGLTHREALNLLKAPRSEVVLVVSRGRTSGNSSFTTIDETSASLDRAVEPLLNGTLATFLEAEEDSPYSWGPVKTVILVKDGAGLGFSLDGGKGSIHGDKPLTIKKIFVGGPAEKSGGLRVGDLITSINGTKMGSKSRTEAWNFMKKLGDGEVRISVRSPLTPS